MYSDQDNFSTTISGFRSHNDKLNYDPYAENERLRKERRNLMQMNAELSNQLEAVKLELKKKDEEMKQLSTYYLSVIKEIKDQVKYQGASKISKRQRSKYSENENPNFTKVKAGQTQRKCKTSSNLQKISIGQKSHQGGLFERACGLRKKLENLSIQEACDKCNSLILEFKDNNGFEGENNFHILKNKVNLLKDNPLCISLLTENDLNEFETMMNALDAQVGLLSNRSRDSRQ